MRLTRRRFVGIAASLPALGAWPAPMRAAEAPSPRLRLSDFVARPERVMSLRRGVAAMKARRPSDPRSWFFQAAIHGVDEARVQAAIARDPGVARLDRVKLWNQCPHHAALGAASANFLIWHRAYLYYFERILRDAAADPSLSLPYWDYTAGDQRDLPALYADPDLDPATALPRNPLYDAARDHAFAAGLYRLSDRAVDTGHAFAKADFFGVTSDTGFAGAIDDREPSAQGTLERSPHDNIHLAVGGVLPTQTSPPVLGLMADIPTAGFDPIFFAHHATIDRLWWRWDRMAGRRWGNAPESRWFAEKPWHFVDADGTPRNLERGFYLRDGSLDASYDDAATDRAPLSATLPSGGQPLLVMSMLGEPGRRRALGSAGPIDLSPAAPLTLTIALSSLPAITAPTQRLLLELRDIDYKVIPSVGYDLFVNAPPASPPETAGANYLGMLSFFRQQRDSHAEHGAGQVFDMTPLAAEHGLDAAPMTVTIKPFDLLTPRGGLPPLHRDAQLRIGAINVLLVEGRRAG